MSKTIINRPPVAVTERVPNRMRGTSGIESGWVLEAVFLEAVWPFVMDRFLFIAGDLGC
jgi:hypothetical protein